MRLNDPNRLVRESAIDALGLLELGSDANEDDLKLCSQLIKDVFKTISLHLHETDEQSRKLLLGTKKDFTGVLVSKYSFPLFFPGTLSQLSKRYSEEFQKVFENQTDPPPCKDEIEELMKSIGVLKI